MSQFGVSETLNGSIDEKSPVVSGLSCPPCLVADVLTHRGPFGRKEKTLRRSPSDLTATMTSRVQ